MNKLLLTPKETAEVMAIGRTKVYELLRSRVIDSMRIGLAGGCRSPPSTSTSTACANPALLDEAWGGVSGPFRHASLSSYRLPPVDCGSRHARVDRYDGVTAHVRVGELVTISSCHSRAVRRPKDGSIQIPW
jgi:excisionase family DNA binding protein